ncbi:MAG: hypothetical protein ACTSVV_06110 [Promethearchaeota archaeon]
MESKERAKIIKTIFIKHFKDKGYHFKEKEETNCFRLDVSNLKDISIVKIYFGKKNTILIQGSENQLKEKLKVFKENFENNPEKYNYIKEEPKKSIHVNYTIINSELQKGIKASLESFNANVLIKPVSQDSILYNLKISRNDDSTSIIQYKNGTLTLQGKQDSLFQDLCDLIELTANPSEKEVIARFVSENEEALKEHSSKFTPEILEKAKQELKVKLGEVYDYLDDYNRTLYVVGQTLVLYKLEALPEYSFMVMPISKGFEGFIKKLSVDLRLVDPIYWKTSTAINFLMDRDNKKRKTLCSKDHRINDFLKRISSTMTIYRHFMMHSEDDKTHRIDTLEEALKKVNILFSETKEIFDFFRNFI